MCTSNNNVCIFKVSITINKERKLLLMPIVVMKYLMLFFVVKSVLFVGLVYIETDLLDMCYLSTVVVFLIRSFSIVRI